MDKISFQNKVKEMAEKKPRLFALESDARANIEEIRKVEKYYNVIFPDSYKYFASQYGGGYFGFIVIYSCDCNGMFFIKNNVLKEWIIDKSFLPVVDFETGDFLGFKIKDGICQNEVFMYLHDENVLHEMKMDFYEALLKFGLKYNECL